MRFSDCSGGVAHAPHPSWFVVLLILGVLAACDRRDQNREHVPNEIPSRQWEVGGFEADEAPLTFMRVQDIAIGPSGQIFVLDAGTNSVHVISATGRPVRRFGGEGQGPGEFQRPDQLGFIAGRLWVSDITQSRVTYFSPRGELEGVRTLHSRDVGSSPWRHRGGHPLDDGLYLAELTLSSRFANRPGISRPVVLIDSTGAVVKKVDDVLIPGRLSLQAPTLSGGLTVARQPFAADPIDGVAPDGSWFFVLDRTPAETAGTAHFRIRRYSSEGTLISDLAIDYRAVRFTDEIMGKLVALFAPYLEGRVDLETWREAVWKPAFLPPVSEAVADRDGWWVARESFQETTVWERYDLDGQLLRRLSLPTDFRVLASSETFVIGTELDEFDVPVVVRLDLSHGGA